MRWEETQITRLEAELVQSKTELSEREQYSERLAMIATQRPLPTIVEEIEQLEEETARLDAELEGVQARVREERKKFVLFEFAAKDLRGMLEGGEGEGEGELALERKRKRGEEQEKDRDKKRKAE